MGTPDFAVPSLERLNQSPHKIKAVVTGIDKRRGRGNSLSPTPIKAKTQELGLSVIEVEDLSNLSFVEQLRELKPDLIVVVAFCVLPAEVLKIPAKGAVNLHASLLPKYRGAAPIHWAVMNGEKETGCTVFMLDETVDTGEIIAQTSTEIGKNETTGNLYERLKTEGADLLVKSLDEIEVGSFILTPQDDKKATPAPKLFKKDCNIDFNQQTEQVHNKIRGLSPVPAAWAELDDLRFNMYRSKVAHGASLEPGEVEMSEGEMMAGCKDGSIILEEVQIEGKKKMSGSDFMNGYHGTGVIH